MQIQYQDLPKPSTRLASGKFGRVFVGQWNNQDIVFKIFKYAIHSSIFHNEIAIMSQLSHENIVKLLGYCQHKDHFFCLIIERVFGMDLLDYIHFYDFGKFQKVHFTKQIISALAYIHSQKIIYRDLKPENIMVDISTLHIKLVDFGLAHQIVDDQVLNDFAGTHGYMAPEIVDNRNYTMAVDMYSLGMTLFVLWSEKPPMKRSYLRYYLQSIPKFYRNLIWQCIRLDPCKRPTAANLLEQFKSRETCHRFTWWLWPWACFE
jgi:serine/threonine protein kinase